MNFRKFQKFMLQILGTSIRAFWVWNWYKRVFSGFMVSFIKKCIEKRPSKQCGFCNYLLDQSPTNRAPNEPAMVRNANFGPNWVVFGQKILFFTGEIKSFVTHITENPPRHLVHIVFWSGIGQNVQKMAIFGPKWPKMQILDQIWPFLGQKA